MADYVSLTAQRQLRVTVPPLDVQRRIAEPLSALDDLIENNRRRIDLLEQMAQAIYREWFVLFRFPGHEDVPLIDSPGGPIPRGWEVTTCGDALIALGGGTPSKTNSAYWDNGTIPWYTPSDLTRRRTRFAADPAMRITPEGLRSSSARLFPAGSVLMTSRATLGVLAIATTDASCNQGFIVIPPDDRWPPSFIYEWLDHHSEELEMLGTGATFKEITKGAFKRFPFLLPAPDVVEAFRDAVTPIEGHVRILEQRGRNLGAIRELLLPKLVSGEIDVANLDLDTLVEPVA
jgi:type I restriction enzyme S subunit